MAKPKLGDLPKTSGEYKNAHAVTKGDPRVDGPYLDDIRAAQADAYHRARNSKPEKAADEKAAITDESK